MMVRVSEWAFYDVNLGGIAEVQWLLSYVGGMKAFFFFPLCSGKTGPHLPPKIK